MAIDWDRLKYDDRYRRDVFDGLIRDYGEDITRFCGRRLGEGLADDTAQETFVTAWNQLTTFKPERPIRAWLFGIARLKCKQSYRNRVRRRAIDDNFMHEIRQQVHLEPLGIPGDVPSHELRQAQLCQSMELLDEKDRILLNLYYWRGLSSEEISQVWGKSTPAIRKQLERARGRLREKLIDVA